MYRRKSDIGWSCCVTAGKLVAVAETSCDALPRTGVRGLASATMNVASENEMLPPASHSFGRSTAVKPAYVLLMWSVLLLFQTHVGLFSVESTLPVRYCC